METQYPNLAPFAKVAAKLLQGTLFEEDWKDLWEQLLRYQVETVQYFERIGLEVVIDKRDGYAYLRQMELDDKGSTIGLIPRMPLTYEQTLVCVLLREWLHEFEINDTETRNLYITPKQFRERLELFFKEKANEVKFIKELNKYLTSIIKFGFLKLVKENAQDADDNIYEVRRIIKARITTDELAYFKKLLEEDAQSV